MKGSIDARVSGPGAEWVGEVTSRGSKLAFEWGVELRGQEGLDLMSVSCQMSSPVPDLFRARVMATSFDDMLVTRTRAQHLVVERTPETLDDFYSEFLQIGFTISGATSTEHLQRSFVSDPEHVAILFPGSTFTSVFTRSSEVVQFYLPITLLAEHGFSPVQFAGRGWGELPTARATRQFLVSITSDLPVRARSLSPGFIARALTELGLGMLYELRDEQSPQSDAQEATRVRVRQYIAKNAHHYDLSVDLVADHVGTSRRYLQGLFVGESLGVGELIRTTRLQYAAERLLARPLLPMSRVAAVTGFRGPDQLSRAFRALYGVTPSEYRRQGLAPPLSTNTPSGVKSLQV